MFASLNFLYKIFYEIIFILIKCIILEYRPNRH